MKAAELLVRCLENEGVELIFGLPGEENIDVTFYSDTIFHQMAGSGRMGSPSYMIVVEPLMSGP